MIIVQYNINFNVNDGTNRLENIIFVLLMCIDADIICLQEVHRDIRRRIADELSSVYKYIDSREPTQRYDTMILSKHKIVDTFRIKYLSSKMGRNICITKIEYGTGTPKNIFVCTTHFESEFEIVNTKISQYEECSSYLENIFSEQKYPVILCADTNICKKTQNVFNKNFSCDDGWKDAWIESGLPLNSKYTYDSTTNPYILHMQKCKSSPLRKGIRSRIDRILFIGNLMCNTTKLTGTSDDRSKLFSDHYGVIANFTFTADLSEKERQSINDSYMGKYYDSKSLDSGIKITSMFK